MKARKVVEYTLWALIIGGLAWVLSGLVCSRPLIEPRYVCMICKKPQWQKGKQVSEIQEFICDRGEASCYVKIRKRAQKELGYSTMEKDGYRQMDKRLTDKIDELIRRER